MVYQLESLLSKLLFTVQSISGQQKQTQHLNICNEQGQHLVTAGEIIFCRTVKSITHSGNLSTRFEFQLTDGRSIMVSNLSINAYEKVLEPFLFTKISRSCIVNIRHIKLFNPRQGKIFMRSFTTRGDYEFIVSKDQRAHVEALYNSITLSDGSF